MQFNQVPTYSANKISYCLSHTKELKVQTERSQCSGSVKKKIETERKSRRWFSLDLLLSHLIRDIIALVNAAQK